MAKKLLRRRRWTNGDKAQVLARMNELLARPGMTVAAAASMLDITPSLYHGWSRGRGYDPNGDPNLNRNPIGAGTGRIKDKPSKKSQQPTKPMLFEYVEELPKAAKVEIKPKPVTFTLTYEGDTLTLTCKVEDFPAVVETLNR